MRSFVLIIAAVLAASGVHAMWPDEGMVWYGQFIPPVSVREAVADSCESQGGVGRHDGKYVDCFGHDGLPYWSVKVDP